MYPLSAHLWPPACLRLIEQCLAFSSTMIAMPCRALACTGVNCFSRSRPLLLLLLLLLPQLQLQLQPLQLALLFLDVQLLDFHLALQSGSFVCSRCTRGLQWHHCCCCCCWGTCRRMTQLQELS